MAGKKKTGGIRRMAGNVIIVCLAGIVVVSGWKVFKILRDYKQTNDIYKRIAELAQPEGWTGDIDFDALKEVNPDIEAWLYYESTNINYPVVKGKDNDYYLTVGFDNTWALGGSLFIDCVTKAPFEQFNTIIYGHHMKDGSMFGSIKNLKDPEYAKEHPQFELIRPDGKYHLLICAFLNQPSDSSVYTTNFDEEDVEGKQEYIDNVIETADYVTDEKMSVDERLVVLSTCAYEYQNARSVVVGRMTPWE